MSVPAIVKIVILQATRRRAEGTISQKKFDEQIRRIRREELAPNGLTIVVRYLAGGGTRFLIKEQATGVVIDILNFASNGALESEESGSGAPELSFQSVLQPS